MPLALILPRGMCVCVCVCVCCSHLFWTSSSLDVSTGVTQEEGHTGFLIHLPSVVRAFIFLARRIQPFPSLVDREVEFCVLTTQSFSTYLLSIFIFYFRKKNVYRDSNSSPNVSEGCDVTSELPGRPASYQYRITVPYSYVTTAINSGRSILYCSSTCKQSIYY